MRKTYTGEFKTKVVLEIFAERIELVDFENRKLPLAVQAELLSLNRTSLYYKPVPPSLEEIAVKHEIDHLYTDGNQAGAKPRRLNHEHKIYQKIH